MAKYLFADGCEVGNSAEVVAVDHDAVLGCAAEETTVQAGFCEFEKELVVSSFADGYKVASWLLSEEECVKANLAGR